MKKPMVVLALVLLSILESCKNDDVNNYVFPISFEFNLLNEAGEASTTFKENEDIEFAFKVINSTTETVNLDNFQPDLICKPTSDFLRVCKILETNNYEDIGRPCLPTNCTYEGAYPIGANMTRKIDYFWLKGCERNIKLNAGKYKTGFEYEFKVKGGKYDGLKVKRTFELNFEVY